MHVRIWRNLVSGGAALCFSFHVRSATLEVEDIEALATNGPEPLMSLCLNQNKELRGKASSSAGVQKTHLCQTLCEGMNIN